MGYFALPHMGVHLQWKAQPGIERAGSPRRAVQAYRATVFNELDMRGHGISARCGAGLSGNRVIAGTPAFGNANSQASGKAIRRSLVARAHSDRKAYSRISQQGACPKRTSCAAWSTPKKTAECGQGKRGYSASKHFLHARVLFEINKIAKALMVKHRGTFQAVPAAHAAPRSCPQTPPRP